MSSVGCPPVNRDPANSPGVRGGSSNCASLHSCEAVGACLSAQQVPKHFEDSGCWLVSNAG